MFIEYIMMYHSLMNGLKYFTTAQRSPQTSPTQMLLILITNTCNANTGKDESYDTSGMLKGPVIIHYYSYILPILNYGK